MTISSEIPAEFLPNQVIYDTSTGDIREFGNLFDEDEDAEEFDSSSDRGYGTTAEAVTS
jgi:hypothetical protein